MSTTTTDEAVEPEVKTPHGIKPLRMAQDAQKGVKRLEKKLEEMAATARAVAGRVDSPQPLDDQERVVQELSKRAHVIPPAPSELAAYMGYSNADLKVDVQALQQQDWGTAKWPAWCRDGSYTEALQYGYMWCHSRHVDETCDSTLRTTIVQSGEAKLEHVDQARKGETTSVSGQPLDIKVWFVCNAMTFPWLDPKEVNRYGCVGKRVMGDLFVLLGCKRESYEIIYGKTHTKEELLLGAKDIPSLSGKMSASILGRGPVGIDPEDKRITPQRPGISAAARADGAHVTINMDSLDRAPGTQEYGEGGYIRPKGDGSPNWVKEADGLPGIASERASDLPAALNPMGL